MKIAFVHKRFGLEGGTERMLESLVRGLAARGHEVHVYCGKLDPRFNRTRVATFHRLPVIGFSPGMRALTLLILTALLVRPRRFDAVVHLGRTGPGDVYRAGGGSHRTFYALLKGRARTAWARVRLATSLRHRIALGHERRALAAGGLVVVPSRRALQDLITEYGAAAQAVRVIPNGVDLDRFHPKGRSLFFAEQREALSLGPEELVLLFVGSDFWRKGLDRALAALARLGPHGEEPRLLVLGDDPAKMEFEALAVTLAVRDRVTFLARHPSPEKLYATADLLVIPTRRDPYANVTVEALAAGMPVVTTRENGAVGELPGSEALCVLVDPDDADELAASIRAMLDPARLPWLRDAARQAAETAGEGEFIRAWEQALIEQAGRRRG